MNGHNLKTGHTHVQNLEKLVISFIVLIPGHMISFLWHYFFGNTNQNKKYCCSVIFFLWYSITVLTVKLYCSSKSKIPVWPFLVLSCIGGAYALIPYFVLWKPPPPPIDEDEIEQWPLKFLESKLTAGVCFGFTTLGFKFISSLLTIFLSYHAAGGICPGHWTDYLCRQSWWWWLEGIHSIL